MTPDPADLRTFYHSRSDPFADFEDPQEENSPEPLFNDDDIQWYDDYVTSDDNDNIHNHRLNARLQ